MNYSFLRNTSIQILLIVLSLTIINSTSKGQKKGNGLETTKKGGIDVVVESLDDDARSIDLRKRSIQSKVELELRKADINVSEEQSSPYLYVNVNVVGNAYSVTVEYKRIVYYNNGENGDLYMTVGSTWDRSMAGIHNGSSKYIIESLPTVLEPFLNEYLEAND